MKHEFLYTCRNIRRELLKLDKSLAVGEGLSLPLKNNHLTVHGVRERSLHQILYTFQNTLRNVKCEIGENTVTFKKFSEDRRYDEIPSIGVLVVTAGKGVTKIKELLHLVSHQTLKHVNIYICGPHELSSEFPSAEKFLDDTGLNLSQKKCKLIEESNEDIALLIHDHISLHREFFERLVLDRFWDVYSCQRFSDNDRSLSAPAHGSYINFFGSMEGVSWRPRNQEFDGRVDYDRTFINGGFICVKRTVLRRINWPNHLGWGAMEDIHLSRELILQGAAFFYDNENWFFGSSARLGKRRRFSSLVRTLKIVRFLPNIFLNLAKYGRVKFDD